VNDITSRFTTDAFASCAFDIDINSLKNPDPDFRRYLTDLFKLRGLKFIGAILAFLAPKLMKMLRIQIQERNITDFFRNLLWSTVEYRSVPSSQ
jgi:cytochrome P450 family 9